jgi:hypothetical protein
MLFTSHFSDLVHVHVRFLVRDSVFKVRQYGAPAGFYSNLSPNLNLNKNREERK